MQDYSDKSASYFSAARTEIAPLLPARAERVLDVGCGAGQTLRWLKECGRVSDTTGIELIGAVADVARGSVDRVFVGDAETLVDEEFESEVFDLVLCLDVLEHMVEPWRFVERVTRTLKPGGVLIASVPNVRHISVLIDLVLRGRWNYRSSGLLDRTHLRFFTLSSAKSLVFRGPLEQAGVLYNIGGTGSKSGLVNRLTLGLFREVLATQFILAARKTDGARPGESDPHSG